MIKRKQSRLLVESIIKGDTDKANKLLAKLIAEAEGDREDQAKAEAGIQDQEEGQEAPADDFEAEDLEGSAEGEDEFEELDTPADDVSADEFGSEEDDPTAQVQSDTELNDLVDKQVNFDCQVNNLVLNDLLNQCADLKTALENNDAFDKHSREFYEIKVPLQYYGETLLKIQKNITPLVNQDEIKNQLDEIKSALEELSSKIGGTNDLGEVSTPAQIVDQELGGAEF